MSNEKMLAWQFCSKHQTHHGHKYESCNIREPINDKEERQADNASNKRKGIKLPKGAVVPSISSASQTKCRNCEETNPGCPDCTAMANRAKCGIYSTRTAFIEGTKNRAKYEDMLAGCNKTIHELMAERKELEVKLAASEALRFKHCHEIDALEAKNKDIADDLESQDACKEIGGGINCAVCRSINRLVKP